MSHFGERTPWLLCWFAEFRAKSLCVWSESLCWARGLEGFCYVCGVVRRIVTGGAGLEESGQCGAMCSCGSVQLPIACLPLPALGTGSTAKRPRTSTFHSNSWAEVLSLLLTGRGICTNQLTFLGLNGIIGVSPHRLVTRSK